MMFVGEGNQSPGTSQVRRPGGHEVRKFMNEPNKETRTSNEEQSPQTSQVRKPDQEAGRVTGSIVGGQETPCCAAKTIPVSLHGLTQGKCRVM